MLKRSSIVLISSALLLLCSSYAQSQVKTAAGATEVACVSGCSGGTSAAENGTVAGGTTTGTGISFLYLWDGANWKRATGSTSGLNVICTSGCGSPPATADNTAFTAGVTNVSPTAFVFNNGITALTSGSYGAARVLANRIQLNAIWDAAGNERGANVNAANQLQVVDTPGNVILTQIDNDIAAQAVGFINGLNNVGTVDTGNGTASTETLRVAIASNNTAFSTNATLQTGANVIGSLTANQSVNVTQLGGTTIAKNNGLVGADVQRVTIASDSTGATTANYDDGVTKTNAARVFDVDSGAGTQNVIGINLRGSSSGGSVELGTSTNPVIVNGPAGSSIATSINNVNGGTANAFGVGASGTTTLRVVTATDSTIGTVTLSSDTRQATAANLNAQVVGTVASGATDAGNPVKIGGAFNTTQPTVTDGQRVTSQYTNRGAAIVATGADTFHIVCDSGCGGAGAFTDNTTFTPASSAISNVGYYFNDALSAFPTSGAAVAPRVNALRIPYTDLSKDSSGLVQTLINALNVDITDKHGKLPNPTDKSGYYVKSGLAGAVVSQQNPLPVILPDAPDPCNKRKGNVSISQTATTRLVVGRPGYLIAICYIRVIAGAAEIPSEWEGTGAACGTGTLAVSGSSTAANGESYAANGGFSAGMGVGTIATTNVAGDDFCLAQSGSNRLAGNLTYVYYLP